MLETRSGHVIQPDEDRYGRKTVCRGFTESRVDYEARHNFTATSKECGSLAVTTASEEVNVALDSNVAPKIEEQQVVGQSGLNRFIF
jgi:GH24 family phage-related lysozyme (muramidase)